MSNKTLKTIAVDIDNYTKLQSLGHAGQSYNDVVRELLKKVEAK